MHIRQSHLLLAEKAMLMALSITLCLALWGQSSQSALSEDLVRLHVIAHSDDEAEQQLKLRVRDAVLGCITPMLDGVRDASAAEAIILRRLPDIKSAAASAAEGREVTVSLSRESYPTRHYGSFALPAGEYSSLRVQLGSARGQNWWCVVFPPLCAAASAEPAAQALQKDSLGLILAEEPEYILRFRCAELWDELRLRFD